MRRMYSESELRKLIQNSPAEIIEALKNQDVVVKTIEQSVPNKEFDINFRQVPEGITMTKRYCKALVINNLLLICISCTATNTTEASISYPSPQLEIEVDEEVGDKIICVNGEKLSDSYTSDFIIGAITAFYGDNFTNNSSRKIDKVGKNKFRVFLAGTSVGAGATEQYFARQMLSLF